jgi:hypothetical protein
VTPAGQRTRRSSDTEGERSAPWHRFLGTWTLVGSRATVTGVPEEPYGSEPVGCITYSDDGYMHAILLAPGTDAAVHTVAYAGTWEIRGSEIIHHVTASVIPEWIGTDQVRTYQFRADQMTLTMSFPSDQYVALVWRKAYSHKAA